MSMQRAVIQTTAVVALILMATVFAFGQQAAPMSLPAPAADAKTSAQPAYLTQLHGFQGVLAETLDGSTVASQAVDEKFNPASSIKLATALAAVKTFGPEH
ncbi:MAG TPA: D-alanyl-D-alanine carboxypeptidase, partial [Pyrinomonadaceae bacterium]|nr:D-alanyl-D-alanine carboxypeptidase [Pyrinomonadaceae bacterium]